jgi:DNA-binding NtrC family response regulator
MILFVDDERRYMDSYTMELALDGYSVTSEQNVDSALLFLTKNLAAVELLILDIMMPPGQSFKDADTWGGLRTGVPFFKRVRELAPHLPVIIFTNVSDNQLEEKFQAEANCRFLRKEDCLPHELVETVRRILSLRD